MSQMGLSPGASGNVSLRTRQGLLITPTGMSYDRLDAEDIVALDWTGAPIRSHRRPSSEWRFHLDIYRAKPHIRAIVHCHSHAATVLACAHRDIPAFHYMVAAAGGKSVRCAPYALFGTRELSAHALAALDNRTACLLANHGQIACGTSLQDALDRAVEIEALAAQYVDLLKLDAVHLLSDAEMDAVLEKFRTYGQPPEPRARHWPMAGRLRQLAPGESKKEPVHEPV